MFGTLFADPTSKALALDVVKSATFRSSNNGLWTGLVAVRDGQELDVRQVSRQRWYASDDTGTRHYARTVVGAIKRAARKGR